jgi:hypothetical protein
MAPNGRMNEKLEGLWKEITVVLDLQVGDVGILI